MMNMRSPQGKSLPQRPNEEMAYDDQRGYGGAQDSYRNDNNSPTGFGSPRQNGGGSGFSRELNGHTVLEGYRNDIMNGFEGEKPRYNPLNQQRPQSSALLNLNDSIQVHLLVETALIDAREYELLSQEEVDDLKKHIHVLTQRIEQTRQNLAIQSKYRDAAISMARLYSPTSEKKKSIDGETKRRSLTLFGHNRAGSEQIREAEQERHTSERKCEELALELWSLEKRLIEPQTRLLKHTAGILQMTHKGPKRTGPKPRSNNQQGIPGSPESMYTYTNARSSLEPIRDELIFDERSAYREPGDLNAFGEFGDLIESFPPPPPSKAPPREHLQMIALTEQKLETLNQRLREVIVKANPERLSNYGAPPMGMMKPDGRPPQVGDTLQSHLQYLERGIMTIDQEQSQAPRVDPNSSQELEESSRQLQVTSSRLAEIERDLQESAHREEELSQQLMDSEASMEETLGNLNHDIRDILLPYNSNRPEPPELTGNGLNDQLAYFQESVKAMEAELSRVASKAAIATTKNSGNSDNLERMETTMMLIWDIIQSGEEEARQAKIERRRARAVQNLPDDPDMSPDEDGDPNEAFTLQGFSTKVQWLYAQATKLKDQKKVLQRQIKQQRELNSKSDAQKDLEFAHKEEELERLRNLLTRTERDGDVVREQMSILMEKLEKAQQHGESQEQRAGDGSAAAQAALESRDQTIAQLEEELQDMRDEQVLVKAETDHNISEAEARITAINAELAGAVAAQAVSQSLIQEKDKEIKSKEEEIDNMNMELARLQTEVTIARAELDGAYGSRAQRAAEVAANPAIQKEIDNLTKKNVALTTDLANLKAELAELKSQPAPAAVDPAIEEKMSMLKKELEETISEYEVMTKASIDWEKERENLEGIIDKLRQEREEIEAQLGDEKVRWMGMKSPGVDGMGGGGAGTTSTQVLKNEFKKMMRDTRAESAKALRAEQAERRRLEDELRAIKKAQGPGKSRLSESVS